MPSGRNLLPREVVPAVLLVMLVQDIVETDVRIGVIGVCKNGQPGYVVDR